MNLMILEQKHICRRVGSSFIPCADNLKLGISNGAMKGEFPIHALRHLPEEGTSGWFIWAGDYSDALDFFQPIHVSHLQESCPSIEKYLGLAPGWRVLITPSYEDIWYDSSLLNSD